MQPKFEKFIPKDRVKEKVQEWLVLVGEQERDIEKPGKNLYTFDRLDSADNSIYRNISEIHGVSFIQDLIPRLLATKKNGEKIRVLDVGTGAGLFPDEIRNTFPGRVEVFSTGLSKQTALDYRKKHRPKAEHELHSNDLKWYSVLLLSDFEEFDLIVDSYGEYFYTQTQKYDLGEAEKRAILDYLTAVIKKLKPGGFASLAPIMTKFNPPDSDTQYFISQLMRENNNINITLGNDSSGKENVLRIEKKKAV